MNKIIRYYNKNRQKIIIFISVIVFIIIFIQLLNQIARQQNEEKYSYNSNTESSNVLLENNISQNSNYISNNNINITQYNIINKFVEYCNSNQIENAYDVISDSCKKNLFPTIDDFQNNYINKIFNEKRTVQIEESYYGDNIFKVTYSNNPLATGGYTGENTIKDYIYVLEEQEEYKISLNKFLYETKINKTGKNNDISIIVSKKTTYIDYEEYQIRIINDSDKTIQMLAEDDKIYLLDNYDNKYTPNISSVLTEQLIILPNKTINLNCMFYKTYNTDRKNKSIKFEEIILNYDEYLSGNEKQTIGISINL